MTNTADGRAAAFVDVRFSGSPGCQPIGDRSTWGILCGRSQGNRADLGKNCGKACGRGKLRSPAEGNQDHHTGYAANQIGKGSKVAPATGALWEIVSNRFEAAEQNRGQRGSRRAPWNAGKLSPMPGTVDQNRAARIRLRLKAKQRIAPADVQWLSQYEKDHPNGNGKNYGRSASGSHKVSYTEESTQAAAEGTGSAADMAAAALMTRAEGERLDSILKIGVNALVEAVGCYKSMAAALLEERQADAQTHRALLESLRTHFLERAEAEAELIKVEAEAVAKENAGDPLEAAATQALVSRLMNHGAAQPTDVGSPRKKTA